MKDALGSVQSVLVLGGGSDIAQATRARAGRRDAPARSCSRRATPTRCEPSADELRAAGATDGRDRRRSTRATPRSHAAFVDDVFERVGDIDLALLAFGVLGDQDEAERDAAAARRDRARSNYLGTVSVAVPSRSACATQGHGTIVALSSVAGERARRSNFVYGSSKAGMDAFFQGLGDSLVGTGVHVMVVRPGFVHTKMTEGMDAAPLSTTPEAVADAIVHGLERGTRDGVGAGDAALRDVGAAPRPPPDLPQAPDMT